MEPQETHHNGTETGLGATTPELPPPHLLLDMGAPAVPNGGSEPSLLPTDAGVHTSELDRSQGTAATADDASEISSASSAIPRPVGAAGAARDAPSDASDAVFRPPGSPAAEADGEVVERRRRRTPSTPRASSGIPRLSGIDSGRRGARTASESRQRPKSDIDAAPVSRSGNFGWSRRPQSAMHERSKTDPAEADNRRTPRSSTSSTSSLYSSGGRRMEIRSKIGSLDNAKHQAGGGNVKIFNEKKDFSTVSSKCGSKDLIHHKPGGGNVRITDEKLGFRHTAASRVGSLDNAKHKAGGGEVKIETVKVDFRDKASSKVGSLKNASHVPGGGDKKIYSEKITWEVKPKVGSLKNAKHKPGGGDIQIFSEVLPWTEPSKPQYNFEDNQQIESQKLNFNEEVQPRVGSLDNASYQPGGGQVEIFHQNLPWLKYNKPNLSKTEKDRIDKRGSLEDEAAFDRERQKRYDYKVKGRQFPSSRGSSTESHGFDDDGLLETQRPKKQRHSTVDVRTSAAIVSSNNALSPVHESGELDGNNNSSRRRANDVAFSSLDEVENAKEPQPGSRYANENLRNVASKDNNGAANASSSRRQDAADKYSAPARAEARPQPGDGAASEAVHVRSEPQRAMPTASTARAEPGRAAPSYASTRPPRKEEKKAKSPRKVDAALGARREADEQPHVHYGPEEASGPPAEGEDPWEKANEAWDVARPRDTEAGSPANKENRKPKKEASRGVKDLYRTEGYAERFRLLPPRPEDEAPQPVRLSPLLVEPRRDPSPEWRRKAQLRIDYDRDGREMTLKTNLKPSTRLPRVAAMPEDEGHARPDGYVEQHARTQRSPRRERKPHRISADRLENILPSINRLLDVREPPARVYSLYANQARRPTMPRRRVHRPAPSEPSETVKAVQDEYYDEFFQEAMRQFEPRPKKDPLGSADPELNILHQNITEYSREIDEDRFGEPYRRHEEADNFADYFPASDGGLYMPEGGGDGKGGDYGLLGIDAGGPSPHKFDRLAVEAPALDMSRASAIEFSDQLPRLPINFNAGSATTTMSSVSLQEPSIKGGRRRGEYLKWKPGEVPFDKRSSNKASYSSGLSPAQVGKADGGHRKGDEGFANRFSKQRVWYDDYNQKMRNRPMAEKIDSSALENSTFEFY